MESSQDVIREFVTRINVAAEGGDADPYELLDKGVVVDVFGTTPISGIYRGVEQVKHILISTSAERFECAQVEIQEFIGSKERVAALIVITGQSIKGQAYNEKSDPDGFVFNVRDGKITEIRAYPDTTLIETVLFNNAYVPSGRLS